MVAAAPDEAATLADVDDWSDEAWLSELHKHMLQIEDSAGGGRAAADTPPAAATAAAATALVGTGAGAGTQAVHSGGIDPTDDGAGNHTAEAAVVTDASDSTQIRSFFENLLHGQN